MRAALAVLIVALTLVPAGARPGEPLRPAHTFSIVARDPGSGELGVAVQSHWFAIGTLVPWAEAGVGAVATQSFVEVRYGASGLDLMRAGWSAPAALAALKQVDPHPDVRQVAMIDAQGRVAVHTGAHCIPYAGHLVGESFSVQANLMLNPGVPQAMARAYRAASGSLAQRMLAALEAAQAAGGDLRGRQSAALLVVRGQPTGRPWEDRLIDLRVADHPQPVAELRRLLTLHRAYEHMNQGDDAVERGDMQQAMKAYGAAETLVPDNAEMKFWHAVTLINAGQSDAALAILRQVFASEPRWKALVPRLAKVGLLNADPQAVQRILEASETPRPAEQVQ